jgi:hypothetical protein
MTDRFEHKGGVGEEVYSIHTQPASPYTYNIYFQPEIECGQPFRDSQPNNRSQEPHTQSESPPPFPSLPFD